MEADIIQLKAEIDALKSQLDEIRTAQLESVAMGGGEGISEMLVPIGNVPGGGSSVPGNFEPTFEPDANDNGTMKLAHVGNGYVPFGRKFYAAGDNELDSSAKIDTGTIYLEVTHTTSGQPTILIKGSSSAVDFTQASTSVSLIPLYEITDGAMTLDYRSCMSLTVREV